ncbi:hypothetical protein ATE76_01485 [Sphingopyxis sp. H093]|nr:hypothetical protein ATE76_01485 [Sphingopyxis sp. H093]
MPASDWRASDGYDALLRCDRRAFAWEWLRRNQIYRSLWAARESLPIDAPKDIGLLGWVDPALASPQARPIWSTRMDPKVLKGRLATRSAPSADLFDIRAIAPFVSVEIDADRAEHWLFSDGRWAIRLDVYGGTLLGGPALIEYQLHGVESARSKLDALRQFLALSEQGRLPASLVPRERRASRWILELRVGDAILTGATEQDIARELFKDAIAPKRWRRENASYRLRVQRLVRIARHRLAHPLSGPWFE